jgi:uncharacterized protein YhfF
VTHLDLPKAEFAFPGPLRDRLVAAILTGAKTSTTALLLEYELDGEPLPRAGQRSVLIDSVGDSVSILEVTAVQLVAIGEIDLAHAVDEGEGYESVAAWRAGHESFWHSEQMREYLGRPDFTVSGDMIAVAERFRVVSRIWQPLQVNAAVAAEAAALTAALRATPEAELDRPTCCTPWTVKEEFVHTAVAVARTLDLLDQPPPNAAPVSAAEYYVPDHRFAAEADAARVADAGRRAGEHSAAELIDQFEQQWRAVVERVGQAEPGPPDHHPARRRDAAHRLSGDPGCRAGRARAGSGRRVGSRAMADRRRRGRGRSAAVRHQRGSSALGTGRGPGHLDPQGDRPQRSHRG